MTSLAHPFIDNPNTIEVPNERIKDVEELCDWIKTQPRLPSYTKNHAVLFLHACYWDKAAAQKAMQRYATIRAGAPDVFAERDPTAPGIQNVFGLCQMASMPKTTPEGYKLLIYRLVDPDPSKVIFSDCMKAFCMFNDVCLSNDILANGYVVVFDMKGVRLGHLTRIQLGPLRAFMSYIQEAHPARLKKIHIVHTSTIINQIMMLVKPLIKSEMLSLLQFSSCGPEDLFDKDILPKEYNGELDSVQTYYVEQKLEIETKYREWLIDSAQFKEKPKEKSCSRSSNKGALKNTAVPIRSFSALEID